MGFWNNLLSSVGRDTGSMVFEPRQYYLGASEFGALADVSSMTAAEMWRTQPHFRTVVTFLARNIAQLGLHTFERVDESDRRRDRESVLAQSLADVDGHTTTFELIFALVGDLTLYDRAYWWATATAQMPSGFMIRRLPPTWVEPVMANAWEVKHYKVFLGQGAKFEILDPQDVLAFPGYNPSRMHGSSPTVDALRQTLQEQVEAAIYRTQVWKKGGRVSSVLERPALAPKWSDAARETFREDWYAKFTGRGPKAGGTPILEDGMQLKRIDFNAQEQQFVEAAKLSLTTVAAAFHVNPTMLGQNEGANYSNVREFRKMLYGDTLGPLVAQIEGRINAFLVPRTGATRGRTYVEFNIDEKLQGNFEEQTTALQSSTGAPWMTRNEARSMRNLPAIEGGDLLVTPLNVLLGGQASPVDGQTEGGGGSSEGATETVEQQQTVNGFTPGEIAQLVGAAATLIRSGFAPEGALLAVGLDPVEHLGLLPITVQRPERAADPDEEIEEALKGAAEIRRTAAVRLGAKARPPSTYEEQAQRALSKFFSRQGRVIRSQVGAGNDWWDGDRWDGELAGTLSGLYVLTATHAGRKVLASLGISEGDYDEPRTEAFLREAAARSARSMNDTTRKSVESALADAEADGRVAAVGHVFDVAEDSRAKQAAVTVVAFAAGWGSLEAARQNAPGATKTWRTTSTNPRPSHAALNGVTVGLDEDFPNGLAWPGAMGDADEVAGCRCDVEVNIPQPEEGDR